MGNEKIYYYKELLLKIDILTRAKSATRNIQERKDIITKINERKSERDHVALGLFREGKL